jgi:hypothetical protein
LAFFRTLDLADRDAGTTIANSRRFTVVSANTQPDPWLVPHLAALRASVRAGFRFRFRHLPRFDDVLVVQGHRVSHGAMDMFRASSADDTIAARFRVEDLETRSAPTVWHRHGPVADSDIGEGTLTVEYLISRVERDHELHETTGRQALRDPALPQMAA